MCFSPPATLSPEQVIMQNPFLNKRWIELDTNLTLFQTIASQQVNPCLGTQNILLNSEINIFLF